MMQHQKIEDLVNLVNSLPIFFNQNIGAVSKGLFDNHDELGIPTQTVVEIITALAQVKELVHERTQEINRVIRGGFNAPEDF